MPRAPTSAIYRNGDVEIPFELFHSSRRTIGITVYPGGQVRVRAPRRVSRRAVMDLLRRKEPWLLRKREALREVPVPTPEPWVAGRRLPLLGRELTLVTAACGTGGSGRTPALRGDVLEIPLRRMSPAALHRRVTQWYRERSLQVFRHRLAVLRRDPAIRRLGEPAELSVRRMRRRWGSCFRDGRIVLNVELLGAPVSLIDYVIVHELCHLQEHNHSRRFYRLMDTVMPDWPARRAALHHGETAGFLLPPR